MPTYCCRWRPSEPLPVNIALIRQAYNPFGGAERFVDRTIGAIQAQGADVTLITRRWSSNGPQKVIRCDPFYLGSLWRDWGFSRAVQRLLRSANFDLVQSHERIPGCAIYRAGDGVHAEWLRQRRRVLGVIGRLRITLGPYHAYMLRAERAMFTAPELRAVICISQQVKREIQEHFKVPESKLHVLYNGVDTEDFHPRLRAKYRMTVRSQLGWSDSDVGFLFVGSGFERKGVRVLIDALPGLQAHNKLLVVGHDKHVDRYRRYATALGVADRIVFAGGCTDVRPYYGAADVFVLPSLYEPFGNAALEALACGLPVVTSHKSGAGDLIDEGREGYVVDALDLAALGRAMAALGDTKHRAACALQARHRAEGYTLETMAIKLQALYRELVATPVSTAKK